LNNNNDLTGTENQLERGELTVENPNDSVSAVTQKLEDIHVTVENGSTTTPVVEEMGSLL